MSVGGIDFNTSGTTLTSGTLSLADGGFITEPYNGLNTSGTNDRINSLVNLLGGGTLANYNGTYNGVNPVASLGGVLNFAGGISGAGALTISVTGISPFSTAGNGGSIVQIAGNLSGGFSGPISIVSSSSNSGGIYSNAATATFGNASSVSFTNGFWKFPNPISQPITINAGGTYFQNASLTQPVNITINSGGTLQLQSGTPVFSGAIGGQGILVLSNGNVALTANDLTFSGAAANTLSGAIIIQQGKLVLNKSAGVTAIASPVTIGTTGAAALSWSANDQISDGVVVTLLSRGSGATNSGQIWMRGNTDTIGGLQDTGGSGNAVVQNLLASTTGKLTVAPSAGAVYTYGGLMRDGTTSGFSTVGALAFGVSGAGQQILTGVNNTYTGGTTVNGGTLTLNGALAHANIAVNSGTFNGTGTLAWGASSEQITVGSGGTFDASGMLWDLSNVIQPAGSHTLLLNYTAGGATFVAPGSLQSLLTQYSQIFYSLANSAGTVSATALPVTSWNVNADGNWSTPGNWILSGTPDAPNGGRCGFRQRNHRAAHRDRRRSADRRGNGIQQLGLLLHNRGQYNHT